MFSPHSLSEDRRKRIIREESAVKIQAQIRRWLLLRKYDKFETDRIERRYVCIQDVLKELDSYLESDEYLKDEKRFNRIICEAVDNSVYMLKNGNVYFILF